MSNAVLIEGVGAFFWPDDDTYTNVAIENGALSKLDESKPLAIVSNVGKWNGSTAHASFDGKTLRPFLWPTK